MEIVFLDNLIDMCLMLALEVQHRQGSNDELRKPLLLGKKYP